MSPVSAATRGSGMRVSAMRAAALIALTIGLAVAAAAAQEETRADPAALDRDDRDRAHRRDDRRHPHGDLSCPVPGPDCPGQGDRGDRGPDGARQAVVGAVRGRGPRGREASDRTGARMGVPISCADRGAEEGRAGAAQLHVFLFDPRPRTASSKTRASCRRRRCRWKSDTSVPSPGSRFSISTTRWNWAASPVVSPFFAGSRG